MCFRFMGLTARAVRFCAKSCGKKLRRDQVLAFFRQLPPCVVAMEACGEPLTISIYDLCFVASLPWDEQPGKVFG